MLTCNVLRNKGLPTFIAAATRMIAPGVEGRPVGRQRMDRDAVIMSLSGWSSARIARTYGVTQSAAWRYLARRRAGGRGYRPMWRLSHCDGCGVWGWFRLVASRRRKANWWIDRGSSRWYCSLACYRARGTDPAATFHALRRPRRGGKGKRRSWFVGKPSETPSETP